MNQITKYEGCHKVPIYTAGCCAKDAFRCPQSYCHWPTPPLPWFPTFPSLKSPPTFSFPLHITFVLPPSHTETIHSPSHPGPFLFSWLPLVFQINHTNTKNQWNMPMGSIITRILWERRLSGCFLIGFGLALQDEKYSWCWKYKFWRDRYPGHWKPGNTFKCYSKGILAVRTCRCYISEGKGILAIGMQTVPSALFQVGDGFSTVT